MRYFNLFSKKCKKKYNFWIFKEPKLLGTIELEPIKEDYVVENGHLIESRPYYLAHSNIETLALLDQEHKGSTAWGTNWYLLRTRLQPIRTFIEMKIKIPINQTIPLYKKLSSRILQLKALKMPYSEISKKLQINKKTIIKAIKNI